MLVNLVLYNSSVYWYCLNVNQWHSFRVKTRQNFAISFLYFIDSFGFYASQSFIYDKNNMKSPAGRSVFTKPSTEIFTIYSEVDMTIGNASIPLYIYDESCLTTRQDGVDKVESGGGGDGQVGGGDTENQYCRKEQDGNILGKRKYFVEFDGNYLILI